MGEQCILVIEDYEPLLAAIQDILRTEGYVVFTATNGLEALQVLEEHHPDLILTDILMPKMDGYVLFDRLQGEPEWGTIPVVFLTAKAEKEDILKGQELGAVAYITKPFDTPQLVSVVRKVLEGAQPTLE